MPAAAQLNVEGVKMAVGGDLETGYSGELSNQIGTPSTHGLGIGGTANVAGSYYSPNFLSFNVQPYYTRAQSNADSASIFDNGGYTGTVSLFSGSHFPGSVSFSQVWDATGMYGIPGATGLTTRDSSRTFAVGWNEIVPGLPSISVSFLRGSATSSLLGSDAQNDVKTDSFGVNSSYLVKGFNLGAGYTHQVSDANSLGILGSGEDEITNTATNAYSVNLGHKLPLNGGFGVGFVRTDYDSSLSGLTTGTNNGVTDNANANLSLEVWRLPVTATATYTDNVYGSIEEQIIASGGSLLLNNASPESRALLVNVTTGYRILPHVFVNGYVNRQELWLGGTSFGLTQLGANVNFNMGGRFQGFTATVGMNDSANKQGNWGRAGGECELQPGHWPLGTGSELRLRPERANPASDLPDFEHELYRTSPAPASGRLYLDGGSGRRGAPPLNRSLAIRAIPRAPAAACPGTDARWAEIGRNPTEVRCSLPTGWWWSRCRSFPTIWCFSTVRARASVSARPRCGLCRSARPGARRTAARWAKGRAH